MKKLLIVLLVVALSLFNMSVMAADDKVEISFCVGDATLMINGSEVTVEKPYVVGEGVTLVPIRVITEAFGAKVDWIDETQTVKLEYPDVNITIQIGNPVAEVNGKAEKLLAPPELTESGYTMIPLRFISENFGAVVSYDDATEKITVVKEKSEQGETVKGAADSKYVGDSYYGWSMENPRDMMMDYRSFDGSDTSFTDDSNKIYIDVYKLENQEDYDFENYYNEIKMTFDGYTLVKAEKNTKDSNLKWMHFSAKDKVEYYDFYHYVTPDYIFEVTGNFSNEDTKSRDAYIAILSTFECKYRQDDIYDLSEIKDGFRNFESEYLKLSFNVPENFYMASSEDSESNFEFYENSDGGSSMHMVVYSKSDVESSEKLAIRDHDHNKQLINEDLVQKFTDVYKKDYSKRSAYQYEYLMKTKSYEEYKRDVFFEVGDYVYNMSVEIRLPKEDYMTYVDKIINSIDTQPLDVEEVGVLINSIPEATGVIKGKVGKLNFEVPNVYMTGGKSDTYAAYVGSINGVTLSVGSNGAADANATEIKKAMRNAIAAMGSEYEVETIAQVNEKVINGYKYYYFTVSASDEESTMYMSQYVVVHKDTMYSIIIGCPELSYSKSTKAEIDNIIKSFKFE